MRKYVTLAFLLLCLLSTIGAQRISYITSFPNVSHHEAQITLVVSDIMTRSAVFRMSRSSPGRYATHEFGKNVYDVKAFDQQGKALTINKTDGDVYEVPRHSGYIRLQYTLYANYTDGTYAGIDPDGIHLNMPAAYMWLKGADNVPISIHFDVPDSLHWTIATQLQPTNDPWTFTARSFQYFMDCPTVIGDLHFQQWQVKNPDGKTYAFRIALDGNPTEPNFGAFAEKVRKIVTQAQRVFGETPAYDYGSYTFLASINPYVYGDGMEHRNSTMITLPSNFTGDDRMLGVFAHEFFHCWNVKRIRPKTLEPFNFEKSNMSNELWLAEGFTQYYGELLVLRAGIGSDSAYMAGRVASLIATKMNTPGTRLYSPIDASRMAVFTDAGVAVDKTNYQNICTSYYFYGGAIALALDLELRQRFGKTLDDYMTGLWKKFGKPEVPYTIGGLEDVLGSVTGDKTFSKGFFQKYIDGHEPLDYTPLLAQAGYNLVKADESKAWIGNPRWTDREGAVLATNSLRGTPLYDAGIDIDDVILGIADHPVRSAADLTKALEGLQPGASVTVRFKHHTMEKTASLKLAGDPRVSVISYEAAGQPVTDAIRSFRKSWLGSK